MNRFRSAVVATGVLSASLVALPAPPASAGINDCLRSAAYDAGYAYYTRDQARFASGAYTGSCTMTSDAYQVAFTSYLQWQRPNYGAWVTLDHQQQIYTDVKRGQSMSYVQSDRYLAAGPLITPLYNCNGVEPSGFRMVLAITARASAAHAWKNFTNSPFVGPSTPLRCTVTGY